MRQLLEFIPIALFFIVYQLDGETVAVGTWTHTVDGIFTATAVLIAATALQFIIGSLLSRQVEKRALWTLLAVAVFGGATLLLRDQTFIQWKPTIFNWALALAFILFRFVGKRTLMERTLGGQLQLPRRVWLRLNAVWVANFLVVGALNLYVAYGYSEATWVSYKLYSAIGFTLLLTVITALLINHHIKDGDDGPGSDVARDDA